MLCSAVEKCAGYSILCFVVKCWTGRAQLGIARDLSAERAEPQEHCEVNAAELMTSFVIFSIVLIVM